MLFFNLDITIKEGTFIYKLFDKRDSLKKQPPEVFCKKVVLKNLAIFIRKYLC